MEEEGLSVDTSVIEPLRLSKAFATALVKALAGIEGAVKSATNPHFKSRYADLSAVMEAVKPSLSANGLGLIQRPVAGRGAAIETILVHESGETLSFGIMDIPLQQNSPQGYGSTLSYLRRYSIATALGCPQLDDDGEGAEVKASYQPTPPPLPQGVVKADALPAKSYSGLYYYSLVKVSEDRKADAQELLETAGAKWDDEGLFWVSEKPVSKLSRHEISETEAVAKLQKAHLHDGEGDHAAL